MPEDLKRDHAMTISRRSILGGLARALPFAAAAGTARAALPASPPPAAPPATDGSRAYDKIGLEWAMNIVAICSDPQYMGDKADQTSADGDRYQVWPIIGGSFYGRGIRGAVIPGGGDFPVIRPDGVMRVDARYRLQTDDGQQVVIHNRGLGYAGGKFRLLPTFNVPGRKYAWLRESVFVATLVYPVPPEIPMPPAPEKSNSRMIQVFRVT